MKRVAIIGAGGAGKSVLARALGEKTGLPVVHLDTLFWRPGWVKTPEPEWQAFHAELLEPEEWIIDGNYGHEMEPRIAAADTVIFMDLNRWVSVWGALRRHWRYRRAGGRPDMVAGQRERIDLAFLWWIWRYNDTRRPAVLERLAKLPPSTRVVRLRSRRDARAFLDGLRS